MKMSFLQHVSTSLETRSFCRLIVLVVLIGSMSPHVGCAADPDPIALLRGVENVRANIRSGTIDLTGVRESAFRPQPASFSLSIAFVDGKRRYTLKQRTLAIDDSGGVKGDIKLKRLRAMNNDREAFVRAGLGKWQDEESRSIWDGTDFSQYFVGDSASFRGHGGGSPEFIADPRLFGLHIMHQFTDTPLTNILYKTAKRVTLDGHEVIAGNRAWRVSVAVEARGMPKDTEIVTTYTIEDRDTFRVHKVECRDPVQHFTVESEYDDKIGKGRLPCRVVQRQLRQGKPYTEVRFEVTKAEYDVHVAPETFTWAGMGMPTGTPVSDERIGQRLGYWNGSGLTEEFTAAKQIGREAAATSARNAAILRWGGSALGGILLLVAAIALRRRYRAAS